MIWAQKFVQERLCYKLGVEFQDMDNYQFNRNGRASKEITSTGPEDQGFRGALSLCWK